MKLRQILNPKHFKYKHYHYKYKHFFFITAILVVIIVPTVVPFIPVVHLAGKREPLIPAISADIRVLLSCWPIG